MSEYIVKCNEVVGISGKALIVPDYIDTSKEIVRCRDCAKWSFFDVDDGVRYGECAEFTAKVDSGCGHATRESGFCAWAERRERETAEVWNQWSADDVTCSEES